MATKRSISQLLFISALALFFGCCPDDVLVPGDPQPHPLEAYDSCTISVQYIGIDNEGGTLSTAGMSFDNYGGHWVGNSFTMEWELHEDDGALYSGLITLKIDPETLMVTAFSAHSESLYWTDGPFQIFEISGGAIPIEENDEGSHFYRISGSQMCESVTNIYSRKEDEGAIWEEFVDYGCNEDSYIQVFIWDMN